jgi:hypothetical protein
MPRPLVLSLDGQEFSVSIRKIDREQLYGSVEIEAFDENGNPAALMVLASDGKTLIDKGGTALATLDEKGNSVDRRTIKAVDAEGHELETVPSSFDQTNILELAKTDDYLAQIVKSVYLIQPYGESDIDYLLDHVTSDQIYTFQFSYRGGTEYDSAFVLGNKTDAFMIVGKQANLQFAKLNQAVTLDLIEEEEISADEIEFDLL